MYFSQFWCHGKSKFKVPVDSLVRSPFLSGCLLTGWTGSSCVSLGPTLMIAFHLYYLFPDPSQRTVGLEGRASTQGLGGTQAFHKSCELHCIGCNVITHLPYRRFFGGRGSEGRGEDLVFARAPIRGERQENKRTAKLNQLNDKQGACQE